MARVEGIRKNLVKNGLDDKIIKEIIENGNLVNVIERMEKTLSVKWSFDNNGKYSCLCSAAVKKGVRVLELALENNDTGDSVMPLSYCYCCASSGRRHLQLQLGVELKTKKVISTPINNKGEKPCEIIFEIV